MHIGDSPDSGPRGSSAVAKDQWSLYKHLILLMGELRDKPMYERYLCPTSLPGQSKTPYFITPKEGGRTDLDPFQALMSESELQL